MSRALGRDFPVVTAVGRSLMDARQGFRFLGFVRHGSLVSCGYFSVGSRNISFSCLRPIVLGVIVCLLAVTTQQCPAS